MNINKRSLSMGFKNKNPDNNRRKSYKNINHNKNEYVNSKNKKIIKMKYLFKDGNKNSNNDSPKNAKKKSFLKTIKTRENIINNNIYNNNFINNINISILKKRKTFCVNKIKPRDINNYLSTSNNSDINKTVLSKFKSTENKDNDTDDSAKKKAGWIIIRCVVWILIVMWSKQIVEAVMWNQDDVLKVAKGGESAPAWIDEQWNPILEFGSIPLIAQVINRVKGLTMLAIVVLIIIQWYKIFTKPDDPKTREGLKKTILYIVIWILVIGAAYVISSVLVLNNVPVDIKTS